MNDLALQAQRERSETEMPEAPVAVIDIGSNSVRLVVYERLRRAAAPLFNEKIVCGLGSSIEQTGKLDAEAKSLAIDAMRRFAVVTKAMDVQAIRAVATAAVRDASDGRDFVAELERRTGVPVVVLTGEDEARLSALGVSSAMPDATGLMADLGGGSLELVPIANGSPGQGWTLPLGLLRLRALSGRRRAHAHVEQGLAALSDTKFAAFRGGDMILVGGAWRALARLDMAQKGYPFRILHGYGLSADSMVTLCDLISGLSEASLSRLKAVPKERLDTLPLAALILARLIARLRPENIVFSTYGLREGVLYELLPPVERACDPLLAACHRINLLTSHFGPNEEALMAWLDPLFAEEIPVRRRLRTAASLLCDFAWRVHPDHRASHALMETVHSPLVGLDHSERAFLALAMHARYTHKRGEGLVERLQSLVGEEASLRARQVGLALRLAQTISGGVHNLLERARIAMDAERIILSLDADCEPLAGGIVARRFADLARAFDRAPVILEHDLAD